MQCLGMKIKSIIILIIIIAVSILFFITKDEVMAPTDQMIEL